MNKDEYQKLVKEFTPKEKKGKNALIAFLIGGLVAVSYTHLFEDENFLQARYDMAGRICDNTRIYDARGTVDELSKRLVKKLWSEKFS